MLRYLFWLVLVFALAIGCVYGLSHVEGSVFLLQGTMLYRVSLRGLLYSVIVLVLLCYFLYLIFSFLWRFPRRLGAVYRFKQKEKLVNSLQSIVVSFFEGRHKSTLLEVDTLLKNRYLGALKTVVLILGAESANQIGKADKRESYLGQIREKDLPHLLLPNLLRAEGALKEQKYLEFRDYCAKAGGRGKHLTSLARLRLTYGLQTENADELLLAIGQLKKNGALTVQEYQKYATLGYRMSLRQIDSSDALDRYLNALPAIQRRDRRIVEGVARKYYELGSYTQAVAWSLKEYPIQRSNELLGVIAKSMPHVSIKQQRKTVKLLESWIEKDRENADLLLLLGQLALRDQLWGKARNYLEVSVSIHPSALGWTTLSELYQVQGEEIKAHEAKARAFDLVHQQSKRRTQVLDN